MTGNTASLKTPQDYLDAAERSFEAGDFDGGSILLWESARCALVTLAESKGMPHETELDLMQFAKYLDRERGQKDWHLSKLVTARAFYENATLPSYFLHPEEMEFSKPSVREFVATLTSYRKEAE